MKERKILDSRRKGCSGYSDNGFLDMKDVVQHSWTYKLLTDAEKLNLTNLIDTVGLAIKDNLSYEEAWDLCSDIHSSFIRACGYKNGNWPERERGLKETRTVVQTYKTTNGKTIEIVEITNN